MAWAGKYFKDHLIPTPLLWTGMPHSRSGFPGPILTFNKLEKSFQCLAGIHRSCNLFATLPGVWLPVLKASPDVVELCSLGNSWLRGQLSSGTELGDTLSWSFTYSLAQEPWSLVLGPSLSHVLDPDPLSWLPSITGLLVGPDFQIARPGWISCWVCWGLPWAARTLPHVPWHLLSSLILQLSHKNIQP